MTALPEGFIAHDGKGFPVDGDCRVIALFRDRMRMEVSSAHPFFKWDGSGYSSDIIAYSLKEPDHDAD